MPRLLMHTADFPRGQRVHVTSSAFCEVSTKSRHGSPFMGSTTLRHSTHTSSSRSYLWLPLIQRHQSRCRPRNYISIPAISVPNIAEAGSVYALLLVPALRRVGGRSTSSPRSFVSSRVHRATPLTLPELLFALYCTPRLPHP